MSLTTPPSSHTVRTSFDSPSSVRRTRVLLGSTERGEETRETGPSEFPLHLPREGVVVEDLLVDLREFFGQSASLFVHAREGIQDPPLPLSPAVEFFPSHIGGALHLIAPGRLAVPASDGFSLPRGPRRRGSPGRSSCAPGRVPSSA